MPRRGRPPAPGLLTSREEEVLELLRAGLTNREIAECLSISLQGAKYHVTEILSKLGVSSREEAASWNPEANRRWGFLPLPVSGKLRDNFASMLTPKLAAILTAGTLVVTASGVAIVEKEEGARLHFGAAEPTPTLTPELPDICQQVTCLTVRDIRTPLASLGDAATIATFTPRLPSYIPTGFDELALMHSRPDFASSSGDPYYDQVWATYRNADGRLLTVKQGYYDVAPTGWYDMAPEGMKGDVQVAGYELRWVRGGPRPTTRWELTGDGGARPINEGWDDGGLALFWTVSAREIDAWEITPDGERRTAVRPLEYAVMSSALSLDELVKIAESGADGVNRP